MPKKPPQDGMVHAAGVLLMTTAPEPEFLLMKHPDRWDLPKGHQEKGESDLETAMREMEEEIGVAPASVRIDKDFEFEIRYEVSYKRWPGRSFTKRVKYFLGYLDAKPELALTEHQGFQWWDWCPPHKIQEQTIDPLLERVSAHLENRS